MNRLIKETDQVIKLNLRQLVIFEVLFRLVAGTFYIRLVNQLLRFSLRMAGYSYLTMSNMGAFLLRPATIVCALAAAALGMVLMVVEIGGLITACQSAAYSMRVDSVYILKGALGKAWDACKGRNWKLLPLALADYLMMNSYLLLRILTRIKPLNFVMYEILHAPAARLGLVLLAAALVLIGIPTMLVFFACMIEQKQFRDGFRRSMELLKGRSLRAVVLLVVVNLGLAVGLVLIYVVIVVISAVIVTLFVDSYAAMAVLSAVCARLELVVLFIGGILAPLVDFGALTVIYFNAIIAGKQPAATWLTLDEARAELEKGAAAWDWASTAKNNDEAEVVLAAAGDVPTQEIMAASDKLKELGVKFKVVNVADLLSLQSAKENDEALTDEEFADIFTADKPVLFAYHSYAHDVRGLIYDRPNHDNFNVHGYEEEGSTTTPYDMVRVNRIDRYELTAEALRMIDADKYADKIDELEKFRDEAFQFAVDNGYDHPDYTDWVYSGVNTDKKGAVTATAATAGDNE